MNCILDVVVLHKCVICVHSSIQSEDEKEFNTVKVRTCLQSEDKICVLTLWHIAMICTLPIGVIVQLVPIKTLQSLNAKFRVINETSETNFDNIIITKD